MKTSKMVSSAVAVILASALMVGAEGAELCKWVDENGTVHYDTECPDAAETDTIQVDTLDPEPSTDDPFAASRERMKAQGAEEKTSGLAPASKDYSRMSAAQLARECERDREARLGPERKQLVAQCKAEGQKSASQCERFYADWGNGGRQGGHTVSRMYDNLPACTASRAAQN